GADDVDRPQPLLRGAEHRQQPAHPLQAEVHPEQLEREHMLLGPVEIPRGQESSSSSARSRSSFSRSAWTTAAGALATKPWLDSLPSAREISLRTSSARSAARRRSASMSTASDASTATLPPGTPTVATGSSPLVANSKRASRATWSATRS